MYQLHRADLLSLHDKSAAVVAHLEPPCKLAQTNKH